MAGAGSEDSVLPSQIAAFYAVFPVAGGRFALVARLLSGWLFVFACGCSPPPETLYVASLNLAHGRGLASNQLGWPRETFEANLDAIAAVVNRENPDLLAVQEADAPSIWSGSFDHVQRLAAATGFPHVYHGLHFNQGFGKLEAAYGTAFLSRRALGAPASHRLPAGSWNTKGFVLATVELDGRPLIITSVHLNSESPGSRRMQVDKLVEILRDRQVPLVLMGDLNSQWDHEQDAVRLIARALGLRAFRPESPALMTYRADAPRKRIDWILLSPELEFVSYRVWPDLVSDHLAVAARIRRAR
jgi:endonuclease/exonuclease/phosphatase family metal-dependent hydrolase